jgi:hypothetical protein
MKNIAVIVLLVLAAGVASANDKDVVVQTDKFTGKTTTVLKPVSLGVFTDCGGLVVLGLTAVTKDDGRIMVLISSDASCWQFLRGADVHVLAGGNRIDLGHFEPGDGTISPTAFTNEFIGAYVDRAALEQMAAAGDLQVEVGRYQCKVKPKNIEHLKHFVEALPAK